VRTEAMQPTGRRRAALGRVRVEPAHQPSEAIPPQLAGMMWITIKTPRETIDGTL
jgi:hypothetical protein